MESVLTSCTQELPGHLTSQKKVSSVAGASGFAWEHNKGGHRAGPGPGPTAPRKVDSLQPHEL